MFEIMVLNKTFEVNDDIRVVVMNHDGLVLASNSEDLQLEFSDDFVDGYSWLASPDEYTEFNINNVEIYSLGYVDLSDFPSDYWKTFRYNVYDNDK